MEVNKMLLEERSKAVSDLGEPAVAAAPEQVSEVSVQPNNGKKSRA
jgi:hypothetical protein